MVVNMQATHAAGGGGRAVYNWKEAVALTGQELDALMLGAAITPDNPAGWENAVQHLMLEYRFAALDLYEQVLAGLRQAFEATGDTVGIKITERIQALGELDDPAEFGRLVGLLQAAGHTDQAAALIAASDYIDDEAAHRERAEQTLWSAFKAARNQETRETFGVTYRHDTAPELAALLKIDPTAVPRLEDLKHLLAAKAADGEQIAGRFYRTDRPDQMTMGSLELIFSADKSVSATFALASPTERQAIIRAQGRAVDQAMRQIADKIGFIRSRRGGLDKRDPADVTWVQWQHRMSRKGDPQLHTHVSLLNVVRSRVDGKIGTLDTLLLHGFYHRPRETYHRVLAGELAKLGLPVAFEEQIPAARVIGIPDLVLRHFSGRTADAEKAAAEWLQENRGVNFAELSPRERSMWLSKAAAATRPPKPSVPEDIHAEWRDRAEANGYEIPAHLMDPASLSGEMPPREPTAGPDLPKRDDRAPSVRQDRHKRRPISVAVDARYNVGGGRFDDHGQSQGRRL